MKQFIVAALLLIATNCYVSFLSSVQAVPLIRPLLEFPKIIGEFTMVNDQTFSTEIMENLGVDHYLMREYKNRTGYILWLYIGYYEYQTEGEIIHSPKHCMPGSGWNTVHAIKHALEDPQNPKNTFSINQMLLQKGLDKQLAHYWYHSRGRVIADEYLDRGYMILDALLKHRSDGALIRITGPGKNFESDVKKQMLFASELLKVLDQYLPGS